MINLDDNTSFLEGMLGIELTEKTSSTAKNNTSLTEATIKSKGFLGIGENKKLGVGSVIHLVHPKRDNIAFTMRDSGEPSEKIYCDRVMVVNFIGSKKYSIVPFPGGHIYGSGRMSTHLESLDNNYEEFADYFCRHSGPIAVSKLNGTMSNADPLKFCQALSNAGIHVSTKRLSPRMQKSQKDAEENDAIARRYSAESEKERQRQRSEEAAYKRQKEEEKAAKERARRRAAEEERSYREFQTDYTKYHSRPESDDDSTFWNGKEYEAKYSKL